MYVVKVRVCDCNDLFYPFQFMRKGGQVFNLPSDGEGMAIKVASARRKKKTGNIRNETEKVMGITKDWRKAE